MQSNKPTEEMVIKQYISDQISNFFPPIAPRTKIWVSEPRGSSFNNYNHGSTRAYQSIHSIFIISLKKKK